MVSISGLNHWRIWRVVLRTLVGPFKILRRSLKMHAQGSIDCYCWGWTKLNHGPIRVSRSSWTKQYHGKSQESAPLTDIYIYKYYIYIIYIYHRRVDQPKGMVITPTKMASVTTDIHGSCGGISSFFNKATVNPYVFRLYSQITPNWIAQKKTFSWLLKSCVCFTPTFNTSKHDGFLKHLNPLEVTCFGSLPMQSTGHRMV